MLFPPDPRRVNIQLSSSARFYFSLFIFCFSSSAYMSHSNFFSFMFTVSNSPALLIYICIFSLTVFAPQASLLLGAMTPECLLLNAHIAAHLQTQRTKELSSFAVTMHDSWPPPIHYATSKPFLWNEDVFGFKINSFLCCRTMKFVFNFKLVALMTSAIYKTAFRYSNFINYTGRTCPLKYIKQ